MSEIYRRCTDVVAENSASGAIPPSPGKKRHLFEENLERWPKVERLAVAGEVFLFGTPVSKYDEYLDNTAQTLHLAMRAVLPKGFAY